MSSHKKINVGLIGVGNCASAIVQGVELAKKSGIMPKGLLFENIGGYSLKDINFTLAIDVDIRKIGKDLGEAIFSGSNIFPKIIDNLSVGTSVIPGPVMDGVALHMKDYFMPHAINVKTEDIVHAIEDSETHLLINMLPVGSEKATRFYADVALKSGAAFINGIPVFIASDPRGEWQKRFKKAGLPLIGDDIKGQFGATILHSALTALMRERGVRVIETYQLNVGGNTDFLNMKEEMRLKSKRISKTTAVTSTMPNKEEIEEKSKIRIGPSDYVPFLGNTKVAYMFIKGESFLGFPVELDLKLKVDDKSMFAGAMMDVIRLTKMALDRGISGAVQEISAYYFKHPPQPVASPEEARRMLDIFLS